MNTPLQVRLDQLAEIAQSRNQSHVITDKTRQENMEIKCALLLFKDFLSEKEELDYEIRNSF